MPAQHQAARWPRPVTLAMAVLPGLGPADNMAPVLSIDLQKPFHTTVDWRVTAYQAAGDEGRFGDLAARICFRRGAAGTEEACTPLMRAAINDSDRLVYQTVTGLSVVHLTRSNPPVLGVLAEAQMNYGGSGTATQYAVWAYHRGADRFQPLATFQIAQQGEFEIIDTGPLAGSVVTAEYVLGDGETHFGRHHFAIAVHLLDPVTLLYTDVLHYVTRLKYPSLDEGGVDVIRPEMPATLRILKYLYPTNF